MKNVNQLVLNIQTEGNESYSYVELFEILNNETITPKARSFAKQLNGQVEDAIEIGYGLIMELVSSWDGTGNFHTLFKTSYNNRLINHVKFVNREKRKHETGYVVSLSESSKTESGDNSPMLEVTSNEKLQSFDNMDKLYKDSDSLDELLAKFCSKYPNYAEVIKVSSTFTYDMKRKEKSQAYVEYFGVQSYTEIQKNVSRALIACEKFLVDHDYKGGNFLWKKGM